MLNAYSCKSQECLPHTGTNCIAQKSPTLSVEVKGLRVGYILVFLSDAKHSFSDYHLHQNFIGFIDKVGKPGNKNIKNQGHLYFYSTEAL